MAKAEKGDLIRIVNAFEGEPYKNGDILEVEEVGKSHVNAGSYDYGMVSVYDEEYEIFRKAGEEDSECSDAKTVANVWLDYDKAVEFGQDEIKRFQQNHPTQDSVEHPNHYTQGRFETIEVIEQFTSGYDDGFVAHCVGTATKYIARAPYKHETPLEDLRKAAKYLEFAIGRLTQDERSIIE